jgi:hypothetical protein
MSTRGVRPPVSLARLHFSPGSHEVVYVPKPGHDESEPAEAERIDAMEFVARGRARTITPRSPIQCAIGSPARPSWPAPAREVFSRQFHRSDAQEAES